LDFFRASAATLETSSALRRANAHGLIFTAPEPFFLLTSSSFLLVAELCEEPASDGITSYWKEVQKLSVVNPNRQKPSGENDHISPFNHN
jgi:hypothetical protein